MAEGTSKQTFEFDLGKFGGQISISSAEELRLWSNNEWNAWAWIKSDKLQSLMNVIIVRHERFRDELRNRSTGWASYQSNPPQMQNFLNELTNLFKGYYTEHQIIHSSSVEAKFLSQLRDQQKEIFAAGAYTALLKVPIGGGVGIPAEFIEGMFEAFLFKRTIDWTAAAHAEVLGTLKKQYETNIVEQDKRFQQITEQNTALNLSFTTKLNDYAASLDSLQKDQAASLNTLHTDQSSSFAGVITKHEESLKSIEKSFEQKLALLAPVEYWKNKNAFHGRRALWFAVTCVFTGAVLLSALGTAIYKVIGRLAQNENPKHWQVGVLLVSVFFMIWLMRVLVRLFLSHLHLATDADERKTMILTYLSLIREGTPFEPKDKALILQHIFRSASDGLVKDDATPQTPMSLLSQGK